MAPHHSCYMDTMTSCDTQIIERSCL